MIIDLEKQRGLREGPDEDCRFRDRRQQPLFVFGVEYEMAGRLFCTDIMAASIEDAERHLSALRATGEIVGQLVRREEY